MSLLIAVRLTPRVPIMVSVAAADGSVQIRPYEADQPGIEGLLDSGSDRLWAAQGHRLHGAARNGQGWRRTLVAEIDGRIVGAVTVARNRVHPGRLNLAVEVGAAQRGRGVGRTLVEHARRLRPEPLPLAAKLRPSDASGLALLHRFGGRVYQRCPGVCPDPTSAAVSAWAAGVLPNRDATVLALSAVPREDWVELWVSQYLWVHEDWSPAAEEPLRELARGFVAEADPEQTSVTMRHARVNAVAWVFEGSGGTAEVVAETIERQASGGAVDVAACLARSLSRLAVNGVIKAEIDGHVSDPHLSSVLDRFPNVPREPLHLVEIDYAAAASASRA